MFDRRHPVILLFQTSIGHLSWPTPVCIVFDQYPRITFFWRGGLMFSRPSKWEHASVGRNTISVQLARKTLADLLMRIMKLAKYRLKAQVEKDEGPSGEGQSPRVEKDEGPSGEGWRPRGRDTIKTINCCWRPKLIWRPKLNMFFSYNFYLL